MTRYSFSSRPALSTGRGGLFALSWPLITIVLALGSMQGSVTGLTDPSTPLVAGLLFLMALPTTWLFAILELDGVVAVVLGVVTSLPLWFYMGGRLALVSNSWTTWWRRYVMIALAWAVLAILVLAVVATVAD